jgi:hypothetical protein
MRFILSALMVFLTASVAVAQTNTSSVFRFLEIPPTARAAGLGGNHAGLYNADFSMLHVNPAYLNANNSGSVSASYINFLGDANMGFTSGAYDLDQLGAVGVGIRFIGYGEFDQLDENGNQLGNFNANDVAITGAYSLEVFDNVQAGAGFDFIHSSYSAFKSSAVALSGGVFYQDTASHFSAGLSVRNLGAQITTYDGLREHLPIDVSVGVTKKPEAFPFQLSLTLKQLNNWDMRIVGENERPGIVDNAFRHVLFGGEANLGENIAIRFGYDHYLHEQTKTGRDFDLAGIAFGVGINLSNLTIDFSRSSYSRIGGVTRLSLKSRILN